MNLLLSKLDSIKNQDVYNATKKLVEKKTRVTILPFSFYEINIDKIKYEQMYKESGVFFSEILNFFSKFGVEKMEFINFFASTNEIINQIQNSEILFLPGGAPDLFIERIKEKRLEKTLINYTEPIIGCSAGSMIQCKEFHITPNRTPSHIYKNFFYCEGLGLLPDDIDIEVHFANVESQVTAMKKVYNEKNKKIIVIDNESAVLFDGKEFELLNNSYFYENV